MKPIKTVRYDGIYGAPQGMEDQIGGLPYYREWAPDLNANEIFSVWSFDDDEREAIAVGYNILVGQVGEPIRPMLVGITHLQREGEVLALRPPKPPPPPKDREMG